eukprot:m.483049 g.483049  ORF g.483049 m.483049 type:complete len:303 (+) comp22753_c0_seq1:1790-2698(+)
MAACGGVVRVARVLVAVARQRARTASPHTSTSPTPPTFRARRAGSQLQPVRQVASSPNVAAAAVFTGVLGARPHAQACQGRVRSRLLHNQHEEDHSDVTATPCWNCQAARSVHNTNRVAVFCPECGIIQPCDPKTSYFDLLGIEERYAVDMASLDAGFKQRQRKLHPDTFTLSSEDEQQHSAEWSSLVNKAYQTLRNPLARGEYMLELHGQPLTEETSELVSQEFLMTIFEINEQLLDADTTEKRSAVRRAAEDKIAQLSEVLEHSFATSDIAAAQGALAHMKYYCNIVDNVRGQSHDCPLD